MFVNKNFNKINYPWNIYCSVSDLVSKQDIFFLSQKKTSTPKIFPNSGAS